MYLYKIGLRPNFTVYLDPLLKKTDVTMFIGFRDDVL